MTFHFSSGGLGKLIISDLEIEYLLVVWKPGAPCLDLFRYEGSDPVIGKVFLQGRFRSEGVVIGHDDGSNAVVALLVLGAHHDVLEYVGAFVK